MLFCLVPDPKVTEQDSSVRSASKYQQRTCENSRSRTGDKNGRMSVSGAWPVMLLQHIRPQTASKIEFPQIVIDLVKKEIFFFKKKKRKMQQHRDPHQLLVVSATAKQENRARVGSVQAVRSPIRRTQEFEVHHCTKTKQRASTQPPLLLKMHRFKDES